MNKELVSVIMPAYNAEKFIGMAIESVMKQTYAKTELVIVDDASTDSTLVIMQQYADKWHDKIRISSREQNGGTAAALNDAIELAEGNYICWLSADDLYCENMVESEVDYLRQNKECDAVFSRCAYIDENSQFLSELSYTVYDEFFAMGMAGIIALLLRGNFWHGCTVLAKAECFKRRDRFNVNYRGAQDYDFWLRMAADYNIGYLDQVNVLSRMHSGQGSKRINCYLDEIYVFFDLLCREDIMIKLYQKMGAEYSYENIVPYIEYRIEKFAEREEELNAISQRLHKYMDMIEKGQLHFRR